MPHGVFEIPSIFIAGQAGFYLARLLLHRRENRNLRESMRRMAGARRRVGHDAGVGRNHGSVLFAASRTGVCRTDLKIAVAGAELVLLMAYFL